MKKFLSLALIALFSSTHFSLASANYNKQLYRYNTITSDLVLVDSCRSSEYIYQQLCLKKIPWADEWNHFFAIDIATTTNVYKNSLSNAKPIAEINTWDLVKVITESRWKYYIQWPNNIYGWVDKNLLFPVSRDSNNSYTQYLPDQNWDSKGIVVKECINFPDIWAFFEKTSYKWCEQKISKVWVATGFSLIKEYGAVLYSFPNSSNDEYIKWYVEWIVQMILWYEEKWWYFVSSSSNWKTTTWWVTINDFVKKP